MSGFEWFFAVLSGILMLSSLLVRVLEERAEIRSRRYVPYYRSRSNYR